MKNFRLSAKGVDPAFPYWEAIRDLDKTRAVDQIVREIVKMAVMAAKQEEGRVLDSGRYVPAVGIRYGSLHFNSNFVAWRVTVGLLYSYEVRKLILEAVKKSLRRDNGCKVTETPPVKDIGLKSPFNWPKPKEEEEEEEETFQVSCSWHRLFTDVDQFRYFTAATYLNSLTNGYSVARLKKRKMIEGKVVKRHECVILSPAVFDGVSDLDLVLIPKSRTVRQQDTESRIYLTDDVLRLLLKESYNSNVRPEIKEVLLGHGV